MLSLKSDESIQDFILKLSKKENRFTRLSRSSRRFSQLLSKPNVTKEFHGLPAEGRKVATDGQPLMDVSNREINDDEEYGNPTSKGVQKSALLREFHERRRSKLSSMVGLANLRRSVATPSQHKPLLMSSRKRTPLISSIKNRNIPKDKEVVLVDKPVHGNQRYTGTIPSVRVSPPTHLRSLSENNSGRRGEMLASKRPENVEPNNSRHLRSHQGRTASGLSTANDQDCCRALMFSDIDEEKEPEHTKPLPDVQLSAVKKSGSMLNRRSTVTVKAAEANKNYISPAIRREKTPLINKNIKENQINNVGTHKPVPTYQRRHSGIPMPDKSKGEVLTTQRRRSDMPTIPSNRLTINIKDTLLPITERRVQPTRRKSRIPLHEELPSNKISPRINAVSPVNVPLGKTYDKQSGDSSTKSFVKAEAFVQEGCSNTSAGQEDIPPIVRIEMKDVSTNTAPCGEPFGNSVMDIESKMEKLMEDQKRMEEAFNNMTLEFFAKGKNLMLEYKRNIFDGIQEIKSQFEEISLQKSIANEKNCENCQAVGSPKAKSAKDYTFLGTPMPKINKKRIVRSFSDPTSPCTRSPSVREASFHSVDSVMSPFTNIVGDCDRPSLMPMTPRMRHNICDLKSSLNEQLENLFRAVESGEKIPTPTLQFQNDDSDSMKNHSDSDSSTPQP